MRRTRTRGFLPRRFWLGITLLCLPAAAIAESATESAGAAAPAGHAAAPQAGRGAAPQAGHPAAPQTGPAVHWGYEGDIAPQHWADLSPDYCTCRDGKAQSPIDLSGVTLVENVSLERKLGTAVLTREARTHVMDLVDNGHTVQITNDAPLSLEIEGEIFELVQYHFHAPSEHTVNGRHAPLEIHFVHKSAAGKLAVAGLMVKEGEHDALFDVVLNALPNSTGEKVHIEGLDIDMNELRPLPDRFYRYEGSLTTPPCSEGVRWVIGEEWREISPGQMATIVSHLNGNNRPVQPRNDRELLLITR